MSDLLKYVGFRSVRSLLIFCLMFSCSFLPHIEAQVDTAFEKEFQETYEWRIQQRALNGVYIPQDLEDSFNELKRLAEDGSLDKFKAGTEEQVAERLHFGLGKWIIVNWGMYEGSRFSHYLKNLGLSHPDDMAQFVIIEFHRHLNQKPLDSEALIEQLRKQRAEEYRSTHQRDTIVIDQKKN